MKTTFFWGGFNFKWKKNPHRLNKLMFRYNVENDQKHHLGAAIGNAKMKFNKDTAEFSMYQHEFSYNPNLMEVATFDAGNPILLQAKYISSTHKIATAKRQTVEVPMAQLKDVHPGVDLTAFDGMKVVLNGFHIDAQNNPSGWYLGALGLQVSNLRASTSQPDTWLFDIDWKIKPAASADPIHHGNGSWEEHMDCAYNLWLDVKLVFYHKAHVNIGDVLVGGAFNDKINASLSKAQTREGIPAITGFEIELFPGNFSKTKVGRYMRQLAYYVEPAGEQTWNIHHAFSNDGPLPVKWDGQSSFNLLFIDKQDLALVAAGGPKNKRKLTADNGEAVVVV
jgi:hypothetical protein